MDTRHLRVVLAVAEHGSFTDAAKALFMAQSTLSRQVIALERHLGCELFVRGPRSASLTEPGTAFLPHAVRLLDQVRLAEEAARRPRLARGDRARPDRAGVTGTPPANDQSAHERDT